jgi:phosphohistidine phosphatase
MPGAGIANHPVDITLDFPPDKIDAVAMRRLMLLRHAKSDWSSPGMPDRERPLNARGVTDARTMSIYFARHALVPDLVLCSPAERTRQTAEAIVKGWPGAVEIDYSDRLYEATPEAIIAVVRTAAPQAHGLLVIGHNPGLHEAARMLIAAGDIEPRERLHEKFPTAALAVIDFPIDAWSKLHRQSGRLDRFVTPRWIAAAAS